MSFQVTKDPTLPTFDVRHGDHTPHWLRYGKGSAHVEFKAHTDKKWLSLYATELNLGPGGRSKRVMITLTPGEALGLYEWMKGIYERGAA
jgi:hypothetical protein